MEEVHHTVRGQASRDELQVSYEAGDRGRREGAERLVQAPPHRIMPS